MYPRRAVADPYIGRDIANQFKILEKIGSGGMGSVYKAEQPDMRRFVAIKILHPRYLSRPDLVSRFRREARAMSHLSHPNTARVFLYGQLDDGACYFVMEYLAGKNLAQTVRAEGPMDVTRAVNIMVQVCGALEEAHKQGIVHRDLKPENVFLTTQGGIADYPKVLDFGLAKVTEREMRPGSLILTQEGMVFGTPEFMSPEQARGEKLDGRSDIYSLGIIMYELLTGKLPFDANQPMEFIQKHIKEPPIPLAKRAPNRDWPAGIWEALDRSLAKKPDQRFGTANEFAAALKNVLSPSQPPVAASLPPSSPVPVQTPPMQTSPVPTQQPLASPQQGQQSMQQAPAWGSLARAPNAVHVEQPPALPGSTPKVAWLVLGLGALLALLGTAALVLALLLR
ncbi:MAG: protein kinase [Deltaproteobacteria bacterium]|nr:protein kinase [Deltaproteobacteria bacterium]